MLNKRHWMMFFGIAFWLLPYVLYARGIEYVSSCGGQINGFAIEKNIAYLAQNETIHILDLHDKNRIREIGFYSEPGTVFDHVACRWPILFICLHEKGSYYRGLDTLDVSDPARPRQCTVMKFHGSKGGSMDIATSGTQLLIQQFKEYPPYVYDISNPLKPKNIYGQEDVENQIPSPVTVSVENIARAQQPQLPKIPPKALFAGSIIDVLTSGTMVYVLDEKKIVHAINVADPGRPKYVQQVTNNEGIRSRMRGKPSEPQDELLVAGYYKIHVIPIVDGEESERRLAIQDISDPNNPKTKAYLGDEESSLDRTEGCWLADHWLFVFRRYHNTGMGAYSMQVYDLIQPDKPVLRGTFGGVSEMDDRNEFGFEEIPSNIAISGDKVYVAGFGMGLIVLRFTDVSASS